MNLSLVLCKAMDTLSTDLKFNPKLKCRYFIKFERYVAKIS